MLEERISVSTEVITEAYKGKRWIYDVKSEMKQPHREEFESLTGSMLEQTALRVSACVPFGRNKMYRYKDDPEREWHETYIESYEEVKPGHARVIIQEVYND